MASTTNILDLNNRIDALEKIFHNVEPIQQQIDELKAWTDSGTKDASGNPIILTDGAAFNAEGLAVTLEPIQSGSGTPSPTNVRPITGYTECVVDRDGRNLVDISAISDGKTLSNNDGSIQDGAEVSYVTDYIPVSKNQTIYIPATGTTRRWFYDVNKTAKVCLLNSGAQTYTPTEDGFIRVTANTTTVSKNALQIEYGNTATPYVPYSHDTATITFGQTVYGAIVNPKTGKVTVTHGYITLDGDAGTNYGFYNAWSSATDFKKYMGRTQFNVGNKLPASMTSAPIAISDKFNAVPTQQQAIAGTITASTTLVNALYLNFGEASGLDTTEKQLAWLAQNPVQVCYELETHIELTLSPAELELLKGYNYITTNGATIDLTYQPDNLKADIMLTVSQLYGSKISIFDGILTGGDTGQVLTKTSDDNYDATWETLPATRTTTKKSEK